MDSHVENGPAIALADSFGLRYRIHGLERRTIVELDPIGGNQRERQSMRSFIRHFFFLFMLLPLWTMRNRLKSIGIEDILKHGVLLGFGLGVAWAEYAFFERFWILLGTIPFGYALLLPRLFSIMGSFLFAFLAYSSFLSALSSLYRSDDLSFLLATPIRVSMALFSKWIDVAVHSGATLVFLALPPMIALGRTLGAPFAFYIAYLAATLAFASLGVCIGVWAAMALVAVFPVKRMHQTAAILGLCFAALLITGLRFLHIETLWSEQALENPLILFIQQEPSFFAKFAPGRLFSLAIVPFISAEGASLWLWGVLALSLLFVLFTASKGRRLFLIGWWKSREQADPAVSSSARLASNTAADRSNTPFRALLWKEWLTFQRDPSFWTQLFMMVPLAALYLLNLSFLPLQIDELKPFLAVADVGLVGMIVAAIGARFLFPAVSREGKAIWIPAAAPVKPVTMILQKILFLMPPVLFLALILLAGSALILKLSAPWVIWTLCYGMLAALLIGLLALSLGFWFPSYSYRHLLEVSLGKGAFLFMIVAILQIVSLSYGSIRIILDNPKIPLNLHNAWTLGWAICWISITLICFGMGIRRWRFFNDSSQ